MNAVGKLFEQQHSNGKFPGGQLVVIHRGQTVLDLAIGTARGFRPEEQEPQQVVTPTTRFVVFSASKPVVAVAIAMLEQRGLIDVEAPVAKYWPDFAANGKAELTVLDVLRHRAGVFTPDLVKSSVDWGDPEKVRAAIVNATPRWPRGTLAYQPYEYGWVLGEVVRAVTGQGIEHFVREHLGLGFGASRDELGTLARTYWLGTKPVYVAGNELSKTFEHDNNLPEAVTAIVPGAGIVCTARELATFYAELLRGAFIPREVLDCYTAAGRVELDKSNRLPLRVGRGFLLGNRTPSIYGWWNTHRVFGHAGAFCTLAYADPDRELAVAIVTNGNRGPYDSLFRFAPLGSAIRRAIGRITVA